MTRKPAQPPAAPQRDVKLPVGGGAYVVVNGTLQPDPGAGGVTAPPSGGIETPIEGAIE